MNLRIRIAVLLSALANAACTGAPQPVPDRSVAAAIRLHAHGNRWIPSSGTSYQIQYDGNLRTAIPAAVYDTDGFDTTAAQIAALHALGRKVVCYIDVGTWENWRPDAKDFPKSVLGKPDGGWPGERWLDVRQTAILEPIMERRFRMCAAKGFDGIGPDNIDGYQNDTGFPITAAEQLNYDSWVGNAAHGVGLTVYQKNDPAQVPELSRIFDFAVVEQCFIYDFCGRFAAYSRRNALVVDVEYTPLSRRRFQDETCPMDLRKKYYGILKHLSLNAWIVTCRV
jgi:hypothetical protein